MKEYLVKYPAMLHISGSTIGEVIIAGSNFVVMWEEAKPLPQH